MASGFSLSRHRPGDTLIDYATDRLRALCLASGHGPKTESSVQVFRQLVSPWANRPLGEQSRWISEVSDDNTPIELSVMMSADRIDVRVLFEPQADVPTLSAYRSASLELHDRLERDFGADLKRFRLVQDLFAPQDMQGPFAIWSSVVFSVGKSPSFKTYFNPQAHSVGAAPALVEEALQRLGFRRAWAALAESTTRRGPHLDEIKYFALDLSPGKYARVKVYARHHEATPQDLEAACALQREHVAGEALEFAQSLGRIEALSKRATFTCAAFVEGDDQRPAATTLYIPVCAYSQHDLEVRDRISAYLAKHDFDASRYHRVLDRYTNRPLDAAVGMQSWAAIKRDGGQPRVTIYLATEANQAFPPGSVPAEEVSRHVFIQTGGARSFLDRYPLHLHPFVWRTLRTPSRQMATRLFQLLDHGIAKHTDAWAQLIFASTTAETTRQRLLVTHCSRDMNLRISQLWAGISDEPADTTAAISQDLQQKLTQLFAESDPARSLAAFDILNRCVEQLLTAFEHPTVDHQELLPQQDSSPLIRQLRTERLYSPCPAVWVHRWLWDALNQLYVASQSQDQDPMGTPQSS